MRLVPIFLGEVLLCIFICVCNGAPPNEVGNEYRLRIAFTTAEDQLIVDVLSNIYDGTVSLYSNALWNKVAEKFKEKWEQGTPDFPKERDAKVLRGRLVSVLIHNHPNTRVKVPEDLLRKAADYNKAKGITRQPYTDEENKFLFEELAKPSYTALYSESTMHAIAANHAKKRKAGIFGFEHARRPHNLRSHLFEMKKRGLLPKNVRDKFLNPQTGARTSTSSTSKEAELQVTNGEHDEQFWADLIDELTDKSQVTNGEHDEQFWADLIDELTDKSQLLKYTGCRQKVTNGEHDEQFWADLIDELTDKSQYNVDFTKMQ